MLDTWEGIKQLKAALWALVCVTCSQFKSPQLLVTIIIVTKRWLWLMLFFLSGQHWLFKLGSESPAGGECHSWHPRLGSALWGAVSTRVGVSFSVFTKKYLILLLKEVITLKWHSTVLFFGFVFCNYYVDSKNNFQVLRKTQNVIALTKSWTAI